MDISSQNLELINSNDELKKLYTAYVKEQLRLATLQTRSQYISLKEAMNREPVVINRGIPQEIF